MAHATHLPTLYHSLNHSPPPPHPSLPPPTLPLQVLLVIELLAKTDLREHLTSLRPRSATHQISFPYIHSPSMYSFPYTHSNTFIPIHSIPYHAYIYSPFHHIMYTLPPAVHAMVAVYHSRWAGPTAIVNIFDCQPTGSSAYPHLHMSQQLMMELAESWGEHISYVSLPPPPPPPHTHTHTHSHATCLPPCALCVDCRLWHVT